MEQFDPTLEPKTETAWQPAETAPKDDVILACFDDCPLPVTAAWNEPEQQWVFSLAQVNLFKGKWHDTFFETQYECADQLKAWMPLPQLA